MARNSGIGSFLLVRSSEIAPWTLEAPAIGLLFAAALMVMAAFELALSSAPPAMYLATDAVSLFGP